MPISYERPWTYPHKIPTIGSRHHTWRHSTKSCFKEQAGNHIIKISIKSITPSQYIPFQLIILLCITIQKVNLKFVIISHNYLYNHLCTLTMLKCSTFFRKESSWPEQQHIYLSVNGSKLYSFKHFHFQGTTKFNKLSTKLIPLDCKRTSTIY